MRCPTFLGGMSRGLLGRDSRYHVRQKRRNALAEADVIVLGGSVCDFRLDYGRSLNKRATILAVNRDAKMLKLNTDAFWKPTKSVQADPCLFLIALSALFQAPKGGPVDEWTDLLKKREREKDEINLKKSM